MDSYTMEKLEAFVDFWVKYFVNITLHPTLNLFVDGLNALFLPKLLKDET
jgi:hypothetical protein